MPTEITVTGCGDCPMYIKLHDMDICTHPMHNDNNRLKLIDTCPLTKDSLTIKLKQDETHKTDVRGGER